MPYKISGTVSETTRVIVLKESDWSIEYNTVVSGYTNFEIDVVSGTKTVVGRSSSGRSIGYGDVTPVEYVVAGGSRGVFGGGLVVSTESDIMDYVTINTTGDATDFGDLVQGREGSFSCSNGDNDRGIFSGDYGSLSNSIDYFTISTTGDASDFGDLTLGGAWAGGCSNGTNERGVFAARYYVTRRNTIDYITINSAGNAIDFGDMPISTDTIAALSNATNERGVFAGGWTANFTGTNIISYITISSTSNTTDFGDLNNAILMTAGTSNGTNERGIVAGGYLNGTGAINVIDYVTINSIGNATDFGDLLNATIYHGSTSNGTSERGIVGGGVVSAAQSDVIQYFTINSTGNASDFGDLSQSRERISALSDA